ncbi:DUF4097 family beta strand repeat protein [Clostridium sp. MCC353]|uniref:DUF4097 family beta strand repeat-containing protein n=1 Tax=Clostridium sp. MCC353 TaxID=2592646 RepID=UPI001C010EF3|nr:DUF4097 family beta strand repeat-containing protein [Clostridium sp. MCC353]MBT9779972.1 DUF4097 family beta strand repeat protein [Clostridium sp. MCC353]
MKKLIKVCLITGIICVFIGGGITAAAAVMGGAMAMGNYEKSYWWSDHWLDAVDHGLDGLDEKMDELGIRHEEVTRVAVEDVRMTFSDVRNLDLEAGAGNIKIVEDDTGGEVYVDLEDDTFYQCYLEHDTLKLKMDKSRRWVNLKNDDLRGNVTITIPADYTFHEVDLEIKGGNFEAERINADSLEIEVKAGELVISDGKLGTLSAETSAGSVYCRAEVSGNVDAECKAGSIEFLLSGKEEDYNYDLECRAGSMKVGDAVYEGMKFEKTVDNGAGKRAELECSAGEIIIGFES